MYGIYNYVHETDHVYGVYSVAGVPYLQFVLHVMLFRPWNMLCTFTLALSAICVQCTIWLFLFCSTLISCFPGMLLRYCLSDSEMVPVAPFITGITVAITFHMRWISIVRPLYFFLSWSHFCPQELQHLLICMFLYYYYYYYYYYY